jgi:hypothetical protein
MATALRALAERKPEIKAINLTQRTFGGTIKENVDSWLSTINLNLDLANIPEDKKLDI